MSDSKVALFGAATSGGITVDHVTPSVSRLGGGLFESVRHVSQHLAVERNVELSVIGLSDERASDDLPRWAPLDVERCRVVGPQFFGYSPELAQALSNSNADVIHLHGLWKYPSVAVSRWSHRTGKPHVISPRGMLEPWAVQQSRFRKRVALALYERRNLASAACIHATSTQEAESIRRIGFKNPVAVIPNGVLLPGEALTNAVSSSQVERALFLSRLHPKKGLLDLVMAWNAVRPAGWGLDIVGPDEGGHRAEVEAAVKKHGLTNNIHFHDEAHGEAKDQFYREADLFVLPSYSENFGLVIAEALAHGVPVITTRATPWSELEEHRCGWWIETGAGPLTSTLKEVTALPIEQLREMGQRGRTLMRERYSWERVAKHMLEVYHWVLGRRAAPQCVMFD